MMKYAKYFALIFVGLFSWYIGNNIYLYYGNCSDPVIMIEGVEDGAYFAGKLSGKILGTHPYKVATYSILVDGKPFKLNYSVSRSSFEHSFSIPVDTMDNGKHTLKFIAISGAKHQNKVEIDRVFYVDNAQLHAGFFKPNSDNKVLQGRCFHLQFQVNKPIKQAVVTALSREYFAYPETHGSLMYEAFIPVECEQHPSDYGFAIAIDDHVCNHFDLQGTFQVTAAVFKKKMLHVPSGALDREREFTELSEKDFELKMEELTQKSIKEKMWQGIFEVPLAMTAITTDFGVQRVAQERGCYTHKALDMVASAPRSVVWASQAGVVVLKDRYVHSGNTIIIDHGWGILSMYFHLETYANLEVGQKVRKGNPIGTMGKTGYANGYHLHWEIRVGNIAVDPMQWTKREFII
ncbi:M23 family metallopeptidase [Candidatus Babeliales bacterium]|nr:M23 family metallopeptidase [Candidatus Babeliales bacterium]MBP9843439.1 M23 family metallopeptidase [Candidatus Babeliales bacterium]